jgi:hypothetical protein
LITLHAGVAIEVVPGGLSFVTFWDESKSYGLSLACYVEDRKEKIEVMVQDQMNYYPDTFKAWLSPSLLRISLPSGTVDPAVGEDEYAVHLNISSEEHGELQGALKYLLAGRAQFEVNS